MKKANVKPFVLGCLITAMVMSSSAVFAETTKSIQAVFGRIVLVVNNQKLNQETLLYDGVTYVPIRAAAETLGMEVTYDGDNFLAYLDPQGTNRTLGSGSSNSADSTGLGIKPAGESLQKAEGVDDEFFIGKILADPEENHRLYYLDLDINGYFDEYLRFAEAKDAVVLKEYAAEVDGRLQKLINAWNNQGMCLDQANSATYDDYLGLYFNVTSLCLRTAEAIEQEAKGNATVAEEEFQYAKDMYPGMIEMNNRIIAATTKWTDLDHGIALQAKLARLR